MVLGLDGSLSCLSAFLWYCELYCEDKPPFFVQGVLFYMQCVSLPLQFLCVTRAKYFLERELECLKELLCHLLRNVAS